MPFPPEVPEGGRPDRPGLDRKPLDPGKPGPQTADEAPPGGPAPTPPPPPPPPQDDDPIP